MDQDQSLTSLPPLINQRAIANPLTREGRTGNHPCTTSQKANSPLTPTGQMMTSGTTKGTTIQKPTQATNGIRTIGAEEEEQGLTNTGQ